MNGHGGRRLNARPKPRSLASRLLTNARLRPDLRLGQRVSFVVVPNLRRPGSLQAQIVRPLARPVQ
jgi:hypothetical protein